MTPSMALPFTWRWSRDSRSDRSVQSAICDRATRIANELAVRGNLSRWEHDYLDVLSDLIEAYEAVGPSRKLEPLLSRKTEPFELASRCA